MLYEFLVKHEKAILRMAERKVLDLSGGGPTSSQLKLGLPIFYRQLVNVLSATQKPSSAFAVNKEGMARAAQDANEPAMAASSGRPDEVELAKSAGRHGIELLRLGYTLSHVVHGYGAMCQSITEQATTEETIISTSEFRNLNQCLDVAIAGAVTEYAYHQNYRASEREVERLGSLAHELRNALNSVSLAYQLIKAGVVTSGGSTGQIVDRGLKLMDKIIDRSLIEVRLTVESELQIESSHLLQVVDQIVFAAKIEAKSRSQTLEIKIDPDLMIEVDMQLFHSALSNLIQNAVKYTCNGGKIFVRGVMAGDNIVIEVEDECGGLPPNTETGLFKPFKRLDKSQSGLGLGLNVARRAIELNHGTVGVQNIPGKGCIFRIILPQRFSQKERSVAASI